MGFFVGVQQDRPIHEVDPTDLRRFHENMIERSLDAGPGLRLASEPWGYFSDRRGSSLRPQLVLGIMLMQGFLADWQRGTEVDGSVCRVTANIPPIPRETR
jgi:hypothetical protein